MYYIVITTKYNKIKLMLDDGEFYDENLQQLLRQPYITGIYLKWVDKKEYEENNEYKKVRRLKND